MRDKTKYFLYGETPVKFEPTSSGGLRVLVFDRKSKAFFADSAYWDHVMYDRDHLARRVDTREFERHVARLGGASTLNRRIVRQQEGAFERASRRSVRAQRLQPRT